MQQVNYSGTSNTDTTGTTVHYGSSCPMTCLHFIRGVHELHFLLWSPHPFVHYGSIPRMKVYSHFIPIGACVKQSGSTVKEVGICVTVSKLSLSS